MLTETVVSYCVGRMCSTAHSDTRVTPIRKYSPTRLQQIWTLKKTDSQTMFDSRQDRPHSVAPFSQFSDNKTFPSHSILYSALTYFLLCRTMSFHFYGFYCEFHSSCFLLATSVFHFIYIDLTPLILHFTFQPVALLYRQSFTLL